MTELPLMSDDKCSVVILCGGQGSRLRPLTDRQPKGMVSVGGKPMLDHILGKYFSHGFSRFVICVGYRGDVIRDYYAEPPAGMVIRFSDAGEEASMLYRLWYAREMLASRVIVSYCDTFIDMNPTHLLAYHGTAGADVTLVTAPIRNPFGVVDSDEQGMVTRFVEKPIYDCFIGCYAMEREALERLAPLFAHVPEGGGLVSFFGVLAAARKLAAFPHLGIQINFNTVSEHQEAEAALHRYHTCMEQE